MYAAAVRLTPVRRDAAGTGRGLSEEPGPGRKRSVGR